MGTDPKLATVALEVTTHHREGVPLADVVVGRGPWRVAHLGVGGNGESQEPDDREKSSHQSHFLRSRPVISAGGSIPRSPSTVGATSRREPPVRSDVAPAPTATRGTGLVVCAVCTPPVAGSIIISQFP